MTRNPENLVLYLEDLEYIKEILGPTTTINIGDVPYKEFKEFKKKYYNKEINRISLKNSNEDTVELYSYGSTYVYIRDKEKSLEVTNFLFSKQPKVYKFIEQLTSFISKLWATFVIVSLLYLILIIKDKELISKLLEASFGFIGLIFLPNLLFIVLPSKYAKHRIICRTSDDKQTLFQHPTFKAWVIPIATGLISSLLAGIILYYLRN